MIAANSSSLYGRSEKSSLLPKPLKISLRQRYANTHKCLSSKAAIATLLWFFTVKVLLHIIQPQVLKLLIGEHHLPISFQILSNLVLCFCPLAGYFADNVFERFKTIRTILCLLIPIFIVFGIVAVLCWLIHNFSKLNPFPNSLVLAVGIVAYLLTMVLSVTFNANILQFGMEQLHESPADHQQLYICWYVWLESSSEFVVSALWSILNFTEQMYLIHKQYKFWTKFAISAIVLLYIATFTIFAISAYASKVKKDWFLVIPARVNPYKLVYKVTKFTLQHKVPVRRSAFTYCEDDIPSGLDLGKTKYGGLFSVEEVETVKALYGILKLLLLLGLTFLLRNASSSTLLLYASHITWGGKQQEILLRKILFGTGLWTELVVTVGIPIYVLVIRPFIPASSFGLFKRIGLGIIVQLLSLVCTMIMDTTAHAHQKQSNVCMLDDMAKRADNNSTSLLQNSSWLGIQWSLSSLYKMLMYIGIYEFICSQSPQSMKGLLIGLYFAIEGIYNMLGALLVIPFSYLPTSFPSCGMIYYVVNIGISVILLGFYIRTVRNYKFRIRDEPCHIHRFVEEYYSKTRPEKNYDYY